MLSLKSGAKLRTCFLKTPLLDVLITSTSFPIQLLEYAIHPPPPPHCALRHEKSEWQYLGTKKSYQRCIHIITYILKVKIFAESAYQSQNICGKSVQILTTIFCDKGA